MLDEICSLLGGRAAEELFTGHVSSGALNDLERVTKRIYGMVAYLGMSEKLSNVCYYNTQSEYNFTKPYSEHTAELIDAEVQRLITEQYNRAKQLLTEHAAQHNQLADLLVDREVIFTEDVEHIFGPRPWKSRADVLMEEEALKLAEERAPKNEEKEGESTSENATDGSQMVSENAENAEKTANSNETAAEHAQNTENTNQRNDNE